MNQVSQTTRRSGHDARISSNCSAGATANKQLNRSSQLLLSPQPPNFEWTYDECLLFDILLARFGPDDVGDMSETCKEVEYESNGGTLVSRWERIAALLPDKTSSQCRERFKSLCSLI